MKETKTSPCEHCGSEEVYDPSKPHRPHWSRATISTVECKICGKTVSYGGQTNEMCKPT